jgi:hypothetical protein
VAITGQGRRRSVTVIPQTTTPLLDAFSFDLTESVQITYPGSAFRHPLQTGDEGITDAVHLDAPDLQVEGITANTPITSLAGLLPFSLGPVAFADGDRMTSMLELILAIREAKVPVTVLCSWLRPLYDRWPETINASRGKDDGNTIRVSVRFVRMRMVTTQLIAAVQDSDIVALGQQTVEFGPVPIEVQPFS